MIRHLEEKENILDIVSKGIWIVDFYADWCGPCKMMSSVLEEMNDVNVIKVNTDSNLELARSYGIMSIPTLIFYKDGNLVRKEIGFQSEEQIRKILDSL